MIFLSHFTAVQCGRSNGVPSNCADWSLSGYRAASRYCWCAIVAWLALHLPLPSILIGWQEKVNSKIMADIDASESDQIAEIIQIPYWPTRLAPSKRSQTLDAKRNSDNKRMRLRFKDSGEYDEERKEAAEAAAAARNERI